MKARKGDWSLERIYRNIKDYEQQLRDLKAEKERGIIDDETYSTRRERVLRRLNSVKGDLGDYRDSDAAARYTASYDKLKAVMDKYNDLKRVVSRSEKYLQSAKIKVDSVRANGSSETAKLRADYAELLKTLRRIKKNIAIAEMGLEGAEELDAAAVKDAELEFSRYEDEFNSARGELDKLLRRKK